MYLSVFPSGERAVRGTLLRRVGGVVRALAGEGTVHMTTRTGRLGRRDRFVHRSAEKQRRDRDDKSDKNPIQHVTLPFLQMPIPSNLPAWYAIVVRT